MNRILPFLLLAPLAAAPPKGPRVVEQGPDGKLAYEADVKGNRFPDFSHAGYGGGGVAIPAALPRVTVAPAKDASASVIQAAIDHVGALPLDKDGMRGAVVLAKGTHPLIRPLRMRHSGVVLRGQGRETVLSRVGSGRESAIRIGGEPGPVDILVSEVSDACVPIGADRVTLAAGTGLKPGDRLVIQHLSTKEWIHSIGMDAFPSKDVGSWLDWKPGTVDLRWERTIVNKAGNAVVLDAPLPFSLDASLAKAKAWKRDATSRPNRIGVENMAIVSDFHSNNPHCEEHAWNAIDVDHVEDAWVSQVSFRRFAGSVVSILEHGRRITVEDCDSAEPVSEIAGMRRRTFYTAGQQTLFRRCKSVDGRHDFAAGFQAGGPNAFVECEARDAHSFSGAVESGANGVLFDCVTMDGGGLSLTNREIAGQGLGWCCFNGLLWNCVAPVIEVRSPPGSLNAAVGVWGQYIGNGRWRSLNEFVKPDSFYDQQLRERMGEAAMKATRPRTISAQTGDALPFVADPIKKTMPESRPMNIEKGILKVDGKPVTGTRATTAWWRGHVLPARAGETGPAITRFVPGREGPGATDDLEALAQGMRKKGQAVFEHHWGLWYDRRRDDHQMVRRTDAEAWGPFFEMPWARSGKGKASDSLSKYDLTAFNGWYFDRLATFAEACDRQGIVFVQQMYFQHNVLEAGAHWADFPWRPTNCLQETGFPEPPPYENRKRIFMADQFYDVSHPLRRSLHAAYIRHCLDNLCHCPNVVFQIGEEFTGPASFAKFWMDTVAEWQKERRMKVKISLSCTRDVQDEILSAPKYAAMVSIIDFKYWWYTATGGVYDPRGGANLAPRQQYREWQGAKTRSTESVARMVAEYRQKFPDKAITLSFEGHSVDWQAKP